jgi:hypothetical protein
VQVTTASSEEEFPTRSACRIVAHISATVKVMQSAMNHTSAKITSAMCLNVKIKPGKSNRWAAIAIILLNATQTHVICLNQSITKLDSEIIQYVSLPVNFSLS